MRSLNTCRCQWFVIYVKSIIIKYICRSLHVMNWWYFNQLCIIGMKWYWDEFNSFSMFQPLPAYSIKPADWTAASGQLRVAPGPGSTPTLTSLSCTPVAATPPSSGPNTLPGTLSDSAAFWLWVQQDLIRKFFLLAGTRKVQYQSSCIILFLKLGSPISINDSWFLSGSKNERVLIFVNLRLQNAKLNLLPEVFPSRETSGESGATRSRLSPATIKRRLPVLKRPRKPSLTQEYK